MEVTMVGLQNAGKTSLLRVLAVGLPVDTLLLSTRLTESSGQFPRVESSLLSKHNSPSSIFPCCHGPFLAAMVGGRLSNIPGCFWSSLAILRESCERGWPSD